MKGCEGQRDAKDSCPETFIKENMSDILCWFQHDTLFSRMNAQSHTYSIGRAYLFLSHRPGYKDRRGRENSCTSISKKENQIKKKNQILTRHTAEWND